MTTPRLVLWDVDRTLLIGGGVGVSAYTAAFTAVTGVPWTAQVVAAGRTDRTLTPEMFAAHGVAVQDRLETFFARYADEFAARAHLLPGTGRLLPGVEQVLPALAALPGVVQTLVTGNIRAVGIGKVSAFGLAQHLDLTCGGYGDDPHTTRGELVTLSRRRAEAAHGRVADADVLVVGDTLHDIAAAREAGVTAVGVTTGPATAAEFADAGAHHVLADLSDVDAVVALLSGR